MSYQVLARKWRPRNFSQMIGQAHVVRALSNALDGDRLHHAFLFTGTRGVGKTTVARILAKCLNCEQGVSSTPCGECSACRELDEGRFVDLIEVDAASRAKVDETRELMDNVQFAPTRGRFKLYLIDEVHMFSQHSFNALLKTLEEPPPHVKFLLATTDPQRLPVTVLSRCLQFNLKRLPAGEIRSHLAAILGQEGVSAEPAALALIAAAAEGSMRDALSLLDQAISHAGGTLAPEDVRAMLGGVGRERVHALLGALAEGDAGALMAQVEELAAQAVDFDDLLAELLSTLQRIAVAQLVPEALEEEGVEREALAALAARITPEDVQLYYQIGVQGRRDLPLVPDPRGGFEMIVLRMLAFRPAEGGATPAPPPAGGGARAGAAAPAPAAREAAPAPAPAGGEAAPAPATGEPLEAGAESWPAVVEALGVAGLVRELAANCAFKERNGNLLRLAISRAHRQLTARSLQEKLQAALRAYYGAPIALRVDVEEPGEETPAGRARRASEARQRSAEAAIESDPNVQAICETFGASIEKGSIRPLD